MRKIRILLAILVWNVLPATLAAQKTAVPAGSGHFDSAQLEVSFGYSALLAKESVSPGHWFQMKGGSAEMVLHAPHSLSGVIDVSGERVSHVNQGSTSLSLITMTAGPRITLNKTRKASFFVESLFGLAYGFDSYFPKGSSTSSQAMAFAMYAGGGVEIRTHSVFALRPIQADYLLTTLPNGGNNRQRNIRLRTGVVIRIR